jgi:hypothetical protein
VGDRENQISEIAEEIENPATGCEVLAIVLAAGDAAVQAYREFFDDPVRTAGTRKLYRVRAGRFFHWFSSHGFSLETIEAVAPATCSADRGGAGIPGSEGSCPRKLCNVK